MFGYVRCRTGHVWCFTVPCGLLMALYGAASIHRSVRHTVLVRSPDRTRRTERPPLPTPRRNIFLSASQAAWSFELTAETTPTPPCLLLPPEATNMAPGFDRGSRGGARRCGFEERVGAYARTEGGHFLCSSPRCLCGYLPVCVSLLNRRLAFPTIFIHFQRSLG